MRWEYCELKKTNFGPEIPAISLMKTMSQLGEEGWELAAHHYDAGGSTFYFKRSSPQSNS